MEKTKYIMFVTPKAFSKLDREVIPEEYRTSIEIIPTADIYMNMMDPSWDEDRCDRIAYIVTRVDFEKNLELKNLELFNKQPLLHN